MRVEREGEVRARERRSERKSRRMVSRGQVGELFRIGTAWARRVGEKVGGEACF